MNPIVKKQEMEIAFSWQTNIDAHIKEIDICLKKWP